ncbi:hydroxymethylglutaryl-CoA lyase [Solitalea longa]|uniref:Hydroxymethylglutaryl-CoA lyase n=1 Tax=Solitalea longa TaxID=2079460 RepID=A0A2S5A0L7_9SPHI|nr:hydroxymethylglutaryl-CoA lyase [Solitalea longa]POY36074.1 hydroxymethylglutaryl-CoA lyase [Solitalea longa]
MSNTPLKLIECPRDAMQGIEEFIPTKLKAEYINKLLKVGFDTIDFGSFVSPKAIPQMKDTREVLKLLDLSSTRSKLLAIIANLRGAEEAVLHPEITYLGFPFSISETFQQRNTNSSIAEAFDTVQQIQSLCIKNSKELVIYISMGFGNPYGDEWDADILSKWVKEMSRIGVKIIALSDTIGVSNPQNIDYLFKNVTNDHPKIELGVHLHSTPTTRLEKIDAAWQAGCRRFDSALKGYGGCPMAKDELTGNISTESILSYLNDQQINTGLNMDYWTEAMEFSNHIFH